MACKGSGVRIPVPPPSFRTVPEGSPHNRYENNFTEHDHNNERRQRALNNLTAIEFELAFAATEAASLSRPLLPEFLAVPLLEFPLADCLVNSRQLWLEAEAPCERHVHVALPWIGKGFRG